MRGFDKLDLESLQTPAYVVSLDLLEQNLNKLDDVQKRSGAEILLALKGFSAYSAFPLVQKYLRGTTSSGINEALLAREYFGGEIHVYNPAFTQSEISQLAEFAHTIVFNSQAQLDKFADFARSCAKAAGNPGLEIGLRVNPQYAEVETQIYNPCASGSRLGARRDTLRADVAKKIEMLHFHAMCEQNSDVLERVLGHFEDKFADLIPQVRTVNFGGGHHITRADYDTERLAKIVRGFYARYPNIEKIYLEPGEAIALNAGIFATRVLEIVQNDAQIAILDCSATCHMPDVLEMPYRPQVVGAGLPGQKPHTYSLAGRSCLAGDRIGDYSFDAPLKEGDILIFTDMAHYTMVKTTTFNGVNLPDIVMWNDAAARAEFIKKFGYEDFKNRL